MDRSSSSSSQWPVVIASAIALVVGNGPVLLFTFGVFLKPIAEQMAGSAVRCPLVLLSH